ncbi:MAG: gas vesicle protein [Synechococcales bacterium]|nr:gas vesicle protein [Synechococcales bacterium]
MYSTAMPSPTVARESNRSMTTAMQGSSLADVLERVLDKGIVIAGDISVSVAHTELLNIRIRLLISSVDKAKEIGINWWENNPHFSSQSQAILEQNQKLLAKVEQLESELQALKALPQATPAAPVPASVPAYPQAEGSV